jgi:hypothetical protein
LASKNGRVEPLGSYWAVVWLAGRRAIKTALPKQEAKNGFEIS